MKQVKLYVTDNTYITKGIRNKLQLKFNTKEGIWDNIGDRTYTVLVEISPQSLYTTKAADKPYIGYLERYKDSQVKYHNAFEPTPEGKNRFALFCSQTGMKPEVFFRMNTETAEFETTAGRIESTCIQTQEREMLRWTEQSIDEAYTHRYRQNGYDIHYSCRLFPIFAEIKEKMDSDTRLRDKAARHIGAAFQFGNTDIHTYLCDAAGVPVTENTVDINHLAVNLRGCKGKVIKSVAELTVLNPPRPYNYLDFLQETMTDSERISLTDVKEILYNFYLCGLITFPRVPDRSISPGILHKLMTPASLQGLQGYEKVAAGIRYNDIPDHLLKYSQNAGAILLLDYGIGDFASLYDEVVNKKEKTVLDMLIKRQLCLYAEPCREEHCSIIIKAGKYYFSGQFTNLINPGWKCITNDMEEGEYGPRLLLQEGKETELVELEEDTRQESCLHDIASIIRFLKLYSFGNMETITETIESLCRSVYIGRIGGRYLTLREKNMLSIVPSRLKDMEEYCRLIEGIRSALRNGESVNKIKKGISDMIQENLMLIDSFCKKGAVDEETR